MKKHKFLIIKIISILLLLLTIVSVGLITYEVYTSNVLPSKYYWIFASVIVVLFAILFLFLKIKKRSFIFIIFDVLFFVIMGVCVFGYFKLNELMTFLDDNLGAKYETNIYYIVVNNSSKYSSVADIEGKTVKLVDDLGDKDTLERSIKKKAKVSFEYVNNISELLYEVETNKDLIIVANSGNYDAMIENDDMVESKVRFDQTVKILETVEIQYRTENVDTGIDVTKDVFAIYLSGIDTRSGKLPSKSLSDVNILMVVNPNTHSILMVNTPRDYYVQVDGTKGSKDKLTHAGLIGGVSTSMATISNLYGVDIKYYARVNFNAVVKLVDAIGGITLYNDQNKNVKCWTNQDCIFKPGNNNVDGACALAFARERHAYKQGDRHRGENQEQVIQKVVEKVTSTKTLVTGFDKILNALEGTFQTNLSTDEITSLVNLEIEDNFPSWTFETYNVSGTDAYKTTYSYPNRELYVMVPDENTINEAKTRINNALNAK